MGKTLFVSKGILRLLLTVLACTLLAGLAYLAMVAWILLMPPHGLH